MIKFAVFILIIIGVIKAIKAMSVDNALKKAMSDPEYIKLDEEIEKAKKDMESSAEKINKIEKEQQELYKEARKLGIKFKDDATFGEVMDAFDERRKTLKEKFEKAKK